MKKWAQVGLRGAAPGSNHNDKYDTAPTLLPPENERNRNREFQWAPSHIRAGVHRTVSYVRRTYCRERSEGRSAEQEQDDENPTAAGGGRETASRRPHTHSHHGMEVGFRGAAPGSNETAPTLPSPLLNIRKLNTIVRGVGSSPGERTGRDKCFKKCGKEAATRVECLTWRTENLPWANVL